MNTQLEPRPRAFTVSAANKTLPLVRAIVSDIVELYRDVADRKGRLKSLRRPKASRESRPGDPYGEEVEAVQASLDRDVERLQQYVEELHELGIELKDPQEGLVDFPTVMDGQDAFLCWKLGEAEVAFWRTAKAGLAHREPLPPPSSDHAV
jgi:hypothetical protein